MLATDRHDKKLRPGDLAGNQFTLRLRDLSDPQEVVTRLTLIEQGGVPNYFGSQRFGHDGNNVVKARQWGNDEFRVRDKSKRSFYLSAARSWLFNLVLSARIELQTVNQVLLGDSLVVNGEAVIAAEDLEHYQAVMDKRQGELTAPMMGDNALPTQGVAQEFEMQVVEQEPLLLKLIRDNRMRHERRPLLLRPTELAWQQQDDDISVSFGLPAGCFATAVVRELIQERVDDEQ